MTIQVYRDDIDNIYLQKYTQEFVGENKNVYQYHSNDFDLVVFYKRLF